MASRVISEAAQLAFAAGRHTQTAIGKELEVHTVSGLKVSKGGRRGAEITRGTRSDDTLKVLRAMEQLLSTKPKIKGNVSWAATEAKRKGYGTSAGANRKLWNDHRK